MHERGVFRTDLNENPNEGSFFLDELTELVEEANLMELERISTRGGVLGAIKPDMKKQNSR